MNLPIYLDHQATTPVDPQVLRVMMPFFQRSFGNASSRNHSYGQAADAAVELARIQVSDLVGALPEEITFTSGSTEAVNLALKGAAHYYAPNGGHIITSQAEHRAVLDVCGYLETTGIEVTYLQPDAFGRVAPSQVLRALREETFLVALIWANNEVGTLNPMREIGRTCQEHGALLFSDATQAAGKVPISVEEDGVDLLCLSGHKLYGPKGVGALYSRSRSPRVRLFPQIDGGGHEHGLRSGTLNVPGIAGLGAACQLARSEIEPEGERLARLREQLHQRLVSGLDGVHLNGHPLQRIAGNLNLSFHGVNEEGLVVGFDNIAISAGCACSTASRRPSHVLTSIGLEGELARSAIRIGLGRFTTAEEIEYAATEIVRVVERRRAVSRTALRSRQLKAL